MEKRPHYSLPPLLRRYLPRAARVALWLLAIGVAVLAGTFAAFTWWVLPNLDSWRPELERELSQTVGRQVSIRQLSGAWQGVAPRLTLKGFTLSNPQSGSALTLDAVIIKPSWASLLVWEPRFSRIQVDSPKVELVRGKDKVLYLNGMDVSSTPSDGRFSNWLLQQERIEINGASLRWRDEWLGLQPLSLERGDLKLTHGLLGHKLQIIGRPERALGEAVTLDARWRGDDVNQFSRWSGKINLRLAGARVGAWSRYLERFGLLRTGHGNGEMRAEFNEGVLTSLFADVKVSGAVFRPTGVGEMSLPEFSGKVDLQRSRDGIYKVKASDLTLATENGLAFNRANAEAQYQAGLKGFGEVKIDNSDLAPLAPIIHALGADRNPLFARFAPLGRLSGLSTQWKGAIDAPKSYRVATRFTRLGWSEDKQVPGLTGASGEIHFNEKGGELQLDSKDTQVRLSRVFAKPLSFSQLSAKVDWSLEPTGVAVRISSVDFTNKDLSGQLDGNYRYTRQGPGQIELTGRIGAVPIVRVPDYLPYDAGKDTIDWLTGALKGGTARNVALELKGDLAAFPFKGGKGGHFSVKTDIDRGQLRFDPAWPTLDGIQGLLAFENERMTVTANQVSTLGLPLSKVVVTIPDLDASPAHLLVNGEVNGPLSKMLAYTVQSPVNEWLGGFTGQLAATGNAKLGLKIQLPLAGTEKEKVNGDLDFAGNTLKFTQLPIPTAERVDGRLSFNENGVDIKSLRLATLGGHFALKANTDAAGKMVFSAAGDADSRQVLKQYVPVLAQFADGHSQYMVNFQVGKDLDSLVVSSPLIGTRFNAPAPANKAPAEALPFTLTLRPNVQSHSGMLLDYALSGRARGSMKLGKDGDLLAGTVLVGRSDGAMPARGIAIRTRSSVVDLDAWLSTFNRVPGASAGSQPLEIHVDTDALQVAGYRLSKANGAAYYDPARRAWKVDLTSTQGAGSGEYRDGHDALHARLSRLVLPLPELQAAPASGAVASTPKLGGGRYPALDLSIDNLLWRNRELGKLELQAQRDGNSWNVQRWRLANKDGRLEGSLVAKEDANGRQQRVDAEFAANADNWGNLLARLGDPGSVVKGRGSLNGRLNWEGGIANLGAEKLNGSVSMNVRDGRFAKVDTGAARLLGVLSLQSIARRFRLDFSDVFQSGFTFDKLVGQATIQRGVFHSDQVSLQGPSADITLKGEVDLVREQQRLQVRVVPFLSESAALGAALVNPIAGVAALAAQKVLQDPLNKLFAVEYLVTGSLSNPDVQQVGGRKTPPSGAK